MDSTLVKRTHILIAKIQKSSKTKHYAHAPRGIDWQEKTIALPRPPLIRKTIREHLMFQICYTTVTIRACYGTCNLQHKYFSNSQLLNQHNSNITIFISQNNYQVSNFSQYSMHPFYESFYYTNLGCLSYQDQFYSQSKLLYCSKGLSK